MFRFKDFLIEEQLLIEDRINTLKTKIFKDGFDTSHDPNAEHKDTDKIVDHFANRADPTRKKIHTQWILNQYKKKNIRQEDHERINTALSHFEQHKPRLEKKDLNQYRHISEVEDAVEPHLDSMSNKQKKKEEKLKGATLLHDDNGVTVHHVKTHEAAQKYGAGTKWCTTSHNSHFFDMYNQQGPIHIIQHKDRKYQYHVASHQFMDEKDHAIDFSRVHDDIKKSLAKSKDPEIQKANFKWGNPHLDEDSISNALNSKDGKLREQAISHPKANEDHITKALKDDDYNVRVAAAYHPNATEEHLHTAMQDQDSDVRWGAINNKNANNSHFEKGLNDPNHSVASHAWRNVSGKAIDDKMNSAGFANEHGYHALLSDNRNLNSDHIHKLMDVATASTVVNLFRNNGDKITPEHIDRALDHRDDSVQRVAIRNPNATYDNLSKAIKNKSTAHWVTENPNLHPDHIKEILKNPDMPATVKINAARHKNASEENLKQALEHGEEWGHHGDDIRAAASHHPNLTPNLISQILKNEKSTYVLGGALDHPKLTPDHINTALDHDDFYVRQRAIQHKNASPANISKGLKDKDVNVRYSALLNTNGNINGRHLHTALRDEDHHIALSALQHPKVTDSHFKAFAKILKKKGNDDETINKVIDTIKQGRIHELDFGSH